MPHACRQHRLGSLPYHALLLLARLCSAGTRLAAPPCDTRCRQPPQRVRARSRPTLRPTAPSSSVQRTRERTCSLTSLLRMSGNAFQQILIRTAASDARARTASTSRCRKLLRQRSMLITLCVLTIARSGSCPPSSAPRKVSTMNFFVCSSCTLITSLRSSFALR